MSNAAARRFYEPESAQVARSLLSELRGAHRNLIAQMHALDGLSLGAAPDPTTLATARWKLGQASLARRLLAARICDYFLDRCDHVQCEALTRLQSADRQMLGLSALHLRKWTADSIGRDWDAYRRDGNDMRGKTFAHIALEQRVLYPMLERAAARASETARDGASDGARTRDLRRDRPAL